MSSSNCCFLTYIQVLLMFIWYRLKLVWHLLLFSCSIMSDFLRPCGLQCAWLPCSSLFPGVCSNSCPLNWWCHPTISSSAISFSSWHQAFPASGSFPITWFIVSGGLTIRASASVLPMNYSRLISFMIDWFDLLDARRTLKSLLQHHSSKAYILWCSAFFMVQLSHPYMTTGKTIAWTIRNFVAKVICLCILIHCLGLT